MGRILRWRVALCLELLSIICALSGAPHARHAKGILPVGLGYSGVRFSLRRAFTPPLAFVQLVPDQRYCVDRD